MVPRLLPILLFATLFALPPHAFAQQSDRERIEEAQRRTLENMRREIRELERTIQQVESSLKDRNKQLADAPKTINPAEKELKESDKRLDKAKGVIPDLKKQLEAADAKLQATLKSLRVNYPGAVDMDKAEVKLDEARAELGAAKIEGVKKLKDDPQYKSAKNRVDVTKTRVSVYEEQRAAGQVDSAQLAEELNHLQRFEADLAQLEAKVLATDARYRKAQAGLEEAERTLTYLRGQMVEKVRGNPDFISAEKEQAQAKESHAQAVREVIEAGKARQEAFSTLNKLKAQVKEFERDTERLKARKVTLESQLRAKEQRADDFARSIGRR